ncbi:MAG TPA: S41 family peptidase [Pyrinomonadaceae bacterium]|nr:S41 family peptidase [Pyrinomonadaceae bacterium]
MKKVSLTSFAFLSSILLCLFVSTTQHTRAQTSPARPAPNASLLNPDFEQGSPGQVPDGWRSPSNGAGYTAQLIEENPKTGKRAAVVRTVSGQPAKAAPFGNLMQSIDASSFRGRRVRLRAAVRTEAAGARAQLWMRVDRAGSQMGFFDNMENRPITLREWGYYEIVGDIEEDAVSINIGMMLIGTGGAWLDDVSLTDFGKSPPLEPARTLSKRGLENLTAFTRVLGYVRHFHPSDEAAAADWNLVAFEGVRAIEGASDASDLARKLETLFRPVAPTLRVFPTGKPPTSELVTHRNETALKVVFYRHIGFGQKVDPAYTIYKSERLSKDAPGGKVPPDSPDPQKLFTADLPGGISILMPIALFADARGTLPHIGSSPGDPEATPPVRYSGSDRATRLADVALSWNIFQHFYPYFDVVKTNWQAELTKALASAATDTDEKAFLNTLRRMVVALHDGHGGVFHPAGQSAAAVPVMFGWIEKRLVITQVAPHAAIGLQAGDVVLKIDGKDAAEVLAETEALISGATPQWRRYRSVNELRRGAKDSELKLDIQSATGSPRQVVLKRDSESWALKETRPAQVAEIKPGIFYLDLDRIKDEDFEVVLPKLIQARGIVFDLRGYPKVTPKVISYLTDKPVESARWLIPIITEPDRKEPINYDERGRWNVPTLEPRLKAKMAFITDGRAISYAESFLAIIEAYKLAAIVGETTAGTNGNVNPLALPGNYQVAWTGMKVLKHDGSQHHGVGIQPTVSVSRTIRGVAEGRDEQLEKAIEVVSQ